MKMCLYLCDFFRGWCWEVVSWGGRPIFLGSAGGRRVARASPGAHAQIRVKQQTLQVTPGPGQWQAAARHLLLPSAHFCLEGCVEIVGYNQGTEKGAGFSPLLSSFSESITKWVRRLKIIWLNFLETDTHSCLRATCFLPPSPSPLSPFPPAHLIFWEEISSFPCGGKETVHYGLTWRWQCLCQASC